MTAFTSRLTSVDSKAVSHVSSYTLVPARLSSLQQNNTFHRHPPHNVPWTSIIHLTSLHLPYIFQLINFPPIPVALRSTSSVWSRVIAGIAGSNPAGGMGVPLLLDSLTKLRKATICPSVCVEQLYSHCTNFYEIFGQFFKTCQQNTNLIKFWQE